MAVAVVVLFLSVCSLTVASTDWVSFRQNHVNLAPTVPRIIGGDEANPNSYPFIVGLLINGNAFCGGTLISKNYVLTAAHCGVAIYNGVEVILGAHNVTANESTQIRINGENTTVHENFTYVDYQNDIALIKLTEPAPINDYIRPVSLPSRLTFNNTYETDNVISIGWGLTSDVDHPRLNDMSQVLRYVDVDIISVSECADYYNDDDGILYVTEKNICTSGYKDRGTCNGDSGGPLLRDGVQIGLVSIGTDLCEVCSPSIFTSIVKFLDWIEEHSDVVTF